MKTKVSMILLVILLAIGFSNKVFAEDENASGFSVTPILSENQTSDITSFFDINWVPDQSERIGLRVVNKSNTEKKVSISVNKARTNSNGIVDYSDPRSVEDDKEMYKIQNLVSFEEELVIPANSSKEVFADIRIPMGDFNGILMGGIHVVEKIETNGTGISNVVAYNIPIVIRGNIDQRPEPSILFSNPELIEKTKNKFVISITINNERENLLKDVQAEVNIKDKKNQILDTKKSSLDITPATQFQYHIDLTHNYSPGEYTAVIKLSHKDNTWEESLPFSVSGESSKAINKSVGKSSFDYKYLVFLAMFVILIISIFIYVRHKRNRDKSV